jgi:hypothetical protein
MSGHARQPNAGTAAKATICAPGPGGEGVNVRVAVAGGGGVDCVAVRVGVLVGCRTGVADGDGGVSVGVAVGVAVSVEVAPSVAVNVGTGLAVTVVEAVGDACTMGVLVTVGACVSVKTGVAVEGEAVNDGVEVALNGAVGVSVGSVPVKVGAAVGVIVGDAVRVELEVAEAVSEGSVGVELAGGVVEVAGGVEVGTAPPSSRISPVTSAADTRPSSFVSAAGQLLSPKMARVTAAMSAASTTPLQSASKRSTPASTRPLHTLKLARAIRRNANDHRVRRTPDLPGTTFPGLAISCLPGLPIATPNSFSRPSYRSVSSATPDDSPEALTRTTICAAGPTFLAAELSATIAVNTVSPTGNCAELSTR